MSRHQELTIILNFKKPKYSRGSEFIRRFVHFHIYLSVFHDFFLKGRTLPRFNCVRFTVLMLVFRLSANLTVFKIKTVSAFWLVYFKGVDRSAIILKQINSKKSVSANRTGVTTWAFWYKARSALQKISLFTAK